MNKNLKRHEILAMLNKLAEEQHKALSLSIKDRLVSSVEFHEAETIGITVSRFPEIATQPIIEAAWAAGKRVAIPKCVQETKEMDFRLFTSYNELETTYFNLQEPIVSKTDAISKKEIDLQIVPGIVFSPEGYRIGFGGGYYDRYLVDFEGNMVSLALEVQIDHGIPREDHDIPVDKIFTDKRSICCRKGRSL